MRKTLVLLVVSLVLTGCGATAKPTVAPTAAVPSTVRPESHVATAVPPTAVQPTATSVPSATPIPPTATVTPLAQSLGTQIWQTYDAIVMVEAEAESLNETAKRCQSGELQGFEATDAVLAVSALAGTIEQSLQITPLPLLSDNWARALQIHIEVKNTLGKWLDDKSSPEQVAEEMKSLLRAAQMTTAGAESILSVAYRLGRNEMTRRRQEVLEAMKPAVEKTPTPTAPVQSSTPGLANLGSVVQGHGYFVQGTAIEDPAKAGSLYQPESGRKLVAVQLVVGNVSGIPIWTNPYNSTLVDTDGFTYRPQLGARDGGQLEMVELDQGQRVWGWIPFQIPEEAKPRGIKYELSWGNTLLAALEGPTATQTLASLPSRAAPRLPKLGEATEQEGYSLSALQVEDPAKPSSYFETYDAEKGMRLVAVEFVIGNVSGALISVNPYNAVLIDSDGFLYRSSLGARAEG